MYHDEIEVADHLPPPPHAAGDFDSLHAWQRGQRVLHGGRLGESVVEQPELDGALEERNALEDVLGRLRAEAGDRGEAAVVRRHLELGQRRDVQVLVDLSHFLHAEPGDLQHLHEAGGHLLAQLVEDAGAPAAEQLADDVERGLPDAFDLRERARLQGLAEIAGIAGDRPGGVLEGADAERVVAFERERRGDLLENDAHGGLVHGPGER